MIKTLLNTVRACLCVVLTVQLMGCGTIMYPERRGQASGKIDAGVAVLDGIGLLLFIIPGVIAFAVDFNNGTIYLPHRLRSSLDIQGVTEVRFDPRNTRMAGVEKLIQKETGYAAILGRDNLEITQLRSTDDMMLQFAKVMPGMQQTQTASMSE